MTLKAVGGQKAGNRHKLTHGENSAGHPCVVFLQEKIGMKLSKNACIRRIINNFKTLHD